MSLTKEWAFTHPSGGEVYKLTLKNKQGTLVQLTNLGNIISRLEVNGVNVVLGFDDLRHYVSPAYLSSYPYLGCVVGRTANRIKQGQFTLDGKKYQLETNLGADHLHGGKEGFDKKVWTLLTLDESHSKVTLQYISPDGEEHYPGTLTVTQVYQLTDDNELIVASFAETDATTLVNLTHHDYFNLNGGGHIGQHRIQLEADHYLGQDEQLVADGRRIPVQGTPYDFQKEKALLSDRPDYDQSFCIREADGSLRLAAVATGDQTGLRMEVWTTDPIVHLYTGVGLPLFEWEGQSYFGPSTGFCFETQKEPNAINVPGFSNTILNPGETYQQKMVLKFNPA